MDWGWKIVITIFQGRGVITTKWFKKGHAVVEYKGKSVKLNFLKGTVS